MIPWPTFPGRILMEDALRPLLAFVRASGWRFVPTRKPAPAYEGYTIGGDALATSPPPDVFLASERRTGDELDTVLGRALVVAFQLGHEQGRRTAAHRCVACRKAEEP